MKQLLLTLLSGFIIGLKGLRKDAAAAAEWAVTTVNTLRTTPPAELAAWHESLSAEDRKAITELAPDGLEALAKKVKTGSAAIAIATKLFRHKCTEDLPDNLVHMVIQLFVSHSKK